MQPADRAQLVVTHLDHGIAYHQIGPDRGWRIDAATRCIVIGGDGATYIPLDTVRCWSVEPATTGGHE